MAPVLAVSLAVSLGVSAGPAGAVQSPRHVAVGAGGLAVSQTEVALVATSGLGPELGTAWVDGAEVALDCLVIVPDFFGVGHEVFARGTDAQGTTWYLDIIDPAPFPDLAAVSREPGELRSPCGAFLADIEVVEGAFAVGP